MKRKIKEASALAKLIDTKGLTDLTAWLTDQAKTYSLDWLLAHLDDGVVWGKRQGGRLVLASEILKKMQQQENPEVKATYGVTPELRLDTLQQARLFNEKAELLLWRDGDNQLQARLIQDPSDEITVTWLECFDEPQLLWGTHGIFADDEFTLIWDGSQGMHQIVPIKLELDSESKIVKNKEPKLRVRHYLSKEGEARVVASRLFGIDNEEEVNHG